MTREEKNTRNKKLLTRMLEERQVSNATLARMLDITPQDISQKRKPLEEQHSTTVSNEFIYKVAELLGYDLLESFTLLPSNNDEVIEAVYTRINKFKKTKNAG